MALLRVSEIRKMSSEQRFVKLAELRTELARLRASQAMGSVPENPSRVRLLRKAIARLITIENESQTTGEKRPLKPRAEKKHEERKTGK